jgi:hypothetical protein
VTGPLDFPCPGEKNRLSNSSERQLSTCATARLEVLDKRWMHRLPCDGSNAHAPPPSRVRTLWAIFRRPETPGMLTRYAVADVPEVSSGQPAATRGGKAMLALSVGIPIVIIAILVFLVIVIFAIRRRR